MRAMICCLITKRTEADEWIDSMLLGSPLNCRKKLKDNQILRLNDKLAEATNEVFKRLPWSSFRINWREPGKRYMMIKKD